MATSNKFFSAINKAYSGSSIIAQARKYFKDSLEGNTAIVSVLSNTGIAGFKFHIPQTEQVKMESDVTDHYIDNNSVVQDHIINKPVTIALNGLQGEYLYSNNKIEDALAKVVPTLTLIKEYIPTLTAAAKQAKNKWYQYKNQVETINTNNLSNYDLYNPSTYSDLSLAAKAKLMWDTMNGVDLFKLFQEIYKLKSAQTRAFLFFETLWRCAVPFTVETTWKRYDNMIITSLVPVRDKNADITDFTISFKQIRTTQSLVINLKEEAGRRKMQTAAETDKGIVQGNKVETV